MSAVDRFAGACVASARRRWPAELSDDMARTWLAELAVLRLDRGVPAPKRWWRQVAFAASLAVSPSPHGEQSMIEVSTAEHWKGRLAGLGRSGLTLVSVIGVALLAIVLPLYISNLSGNLDQHVSYSVQNAVPVVAIILSVIVMGWLGSVIGRWSATSKPTAGRSTIRDVAPRVVALGLAFALLLPGFHPDWGGGVDATRPADVLLAVVMWTLLSVGVITLVVRSARHGRRMAAYAYAIGGTLIAVDLAVIVGGWGFAHQAGVGAGGAVTWFPRAVFDPHIGSATGLGPVYINAHITSNYQVSILGHSAYGLAQVAQGVQGFAGALLAGLVFAVVYALRTAQAPAVRAVPGIAAARPAETPDGVRVPMVVRRAAGAFAVTGVLAWTWVTTLTPVAPPAGPSGLIFPSGQLVSHGIVAVVLISLAVVLLNAGRGPVAAPAVAVFMVLAGTQVAVLAAGWSGAGGAVPTVVVGLAAVVGSWWLTAALAARDRPARTPATAGSADHGPADGTGDDTGQVGDTGPAVGGPSWTIRQTLVAVAVAAILVAPTGNEPVSLAPAGYLAVGYILAALGWLIAVTAALTARPVPVSRIAMVALVVLPLAAVIAFESGAATKPLYWVAPNFFIQAVLAVVVLAVARWTRFGARSAGGWIALGLAAAVLSVTVARSTRYVPEFLFEPLTLWDRFQSGLIFFDGGPANQILVAVGVGLFAARWASRSATGPVGPQPVGPQPVGQRSDGQRPVDSVSGAQIVTA